MSAARLKAASVGGSPGKRRNRRERKIGDAMAEMP